MEINLKRKQEFLAFCQKLQEQKNSFSTKEQVVKLKTYDVLLFDCFLWKSRDSYLKLFASFLNYDISGEEFSNQFIRMRSNHIDEFNELMNQLELMSQLEINFEFFNKFNLDLHAFGFAEIIDEVDDDCDSLVSDELLVEIGGSREDGEIDENQFRERIEKAFLLISKV